ncbi:hypothetical protein [Catenulispora pinistramenti]|uniref:hypothetical protein n=1 Tax=Catenulispora pinistramenti TaxID=2705254 RepID=UPI001BAA4120|nr:hypothetical protein [Catenulispora pinistramenti]
MSDNSNSSKPEPSPQKSSYRDRLPVQADHLKIRFNIEYVTGELGDELHRRQAEAVMEALQWVARQRLSEAPLPTE